METRNIVAFASIKSLDKGNYLPKGIAGIYAIKNDEVFEFYFVQTIPCSDYYHFNKERDVVCIQRIGPNVDLRYLLFNEPGLLERPLLDISGYPRYVDDHDTRRSKEDIEKNMGYETGLCWTSGASILNGNYLGSICRDEIIYHKKMFGFLKRKSKTLYLFNKESHGGKWISSETDLILKYHNIEVGNYVWNDVN
jgi:hypothetical protein